MVIRLIASILFIVIQLVTYSQSISGEIMIVGGGSETNGGWSDEPYSWAVSQADNKRVAIIGADTDPSNWLPNYFANKCGALFAKNFIITSSNANLQSTYDSLVTYDMIFFRGGDQYDYYRQYRNTKTQEAVLDVFSRGGIIAGTSAGLHILSEVVFTAQHGTVYPEEAIADPYNSYMTLKNDFLSLVPGTIFDSHVAERARFARTIGFLGRWEMDHQAITGIAVDDKTAFCLSADLTGICYGTGAVGIYRSGNDNNFRVSGEKLLADNMVVTQLIHNCSINLINFTVNGFSGESVTEDTESNRINLYLSGSDALNKNTQMLSGFLNPEIPNQRVLLLTKTLNSLVTDFSDFLISLGAEVIVVEATISNGSSATMAASISESGKILFMQNEYINLLDFIQGTPNGQAIINKINNNEMVAAFVGSDSRFAAKSVVYNFNQEYASYDGELEFRDGLGILNNAIVMHETFSSNIDNENAATSIPYAMVTQNLRYGIWLYDDAVAHFEYQDGGLRLSGMGNFPMILAKNEGGKAQITDQSAESSGNPRNIAGFEKFTYRLMDETTSEMIDLADNIAKMNTNQVLVNPNPADEFIQIDFPGEYEIKIYNGLGELININQAYFKSVINVNDLPSGIYMVSIFIDDKQVYEQKLIKN